MVSEHTAWAAAGGHASATHNYTTSERADAAHRRRRDGVRLPSSHRRWGNCVR